MFQLELLHCDIQSRDEQLRKQKSLTESVQEDLYTTRELAEDYQRRLSDMEEELKSTSIWLQESKQHKTLAVSYSNAYFVLYSWDLVSYNEHERCHYLVEALNGILCLVLSLGYIRMTLSERLSYKYVFFSSI